MSSDVANFWENPIHEKMTLEEKLVYIFLLTTPEGNGTGIFPLPEVKVRLYTKISQAKIKECLNALADKQLIFLEQGYVITKERITMSINANQVKNRMAFIRTLPPMLLENILKSKFNKFIKNEDNSKENYQMICTAVKEYDGIPRTKRMRVKPPKEMAYKEFLDEIIQLFPEHNQPEKGNEYNLWHETIRLLIDVDGYGKDQIREALQLAWADEMYGPHLKTLTKLRRKKNKEKYYIKIYLNLKKDNVQAQQVGEYLGDTGSRQDY